jgi:energy-coupling factor transport system permease protein
MNKYSNFFADYHPVIVFIYFMSLFALTILISHPVFITVSLIVLLIYILLLEGLKSLLKSCLYMLPMLIIIAILNPIFNHYGNTPILYYNDTPITLEALLYGIFAGILIISLILLFKAFDRCINPHKFIFLFGKFLPAISLMITMIMRFIPLLKRKLDAISQTQAALGISTHKGNLKNRLSSGTNILSTLVSVSLEGTVDTADSMNARGYGLRGKKTHYNSYVYTPRDFVLLAITVILDLLFGVIIYMGIYQFDFYPGLTSFSFTTFNVIMLIVYALFMGLPIIINILEEIRWKLSRQKI